MGVGMGLGQQGRLEMVYLFIFYFCILFMFGGAGPPLQCGPPSSFGEWGLPTVLGFERLISVASFVPEHGLLSAGASEIVVQTLGRSTGCGVFPDQGPSPCPQLWHADSYPPRCQGTP